MTPNQKSFREFIKGFCRLCEKRGGVLTPYDDYSHEFQFETRLGKLRATVFDHDYDSHSKRGFVSIFMQFSNELDAAKIEKELFGDFNRFSGKWNIHFSGDKKDIEQTRNHALLQLHTRLSHVALKALAA